MNTTSNMEVVANMTNVKDIKELQFVDDASLEYVGGGAAVVNTF